jgi:tRNA G18 (ribose-2'-O)-methylase SpoU
VRAPEPVPRWTAAVRDRLKEAGERRGGPFVLEGRKAVLDALSREGVAIREVWTSDELAAEVAAEIEAAAAVRRVPVGRAPAHDVARVSGTVTPQGVLALADDLGRAADEILAQASAPVLLLDRVQDPGNVGAILRVAAAFRCGGVLVGSGTADPLGAKALRASAGTAIAVPFARGTPRGLLDTAARAGFACWLLDGVGEPLWDVVSRPARLLLAVGSEGAGAGEDVSRAATRRLAIPIAPAAESLNAGVAAGIAVAHVARLPVAGDARPARSR